jgi:hypothetical protein
MSTNRRGPRAYRRAAPIRHHLACGAVVTITLEANLALCKHEGLRCPDVEMLARACADELGHIDRNGHSPGGAP